MPGGGAKQDIDRGFVPIDGGAVEHLHQVVRTTAFGLHVQAPRGQQGQAAGDTVQMPGLAPPDLTEAVQGPG
ncbi:hypothetical protein QV12_00095, partial [Pseudomonas putida]